MSTDVRAEVVRRAEIPAIHSVIEGGREHVLGILQEFRRSERMRAFLPKDHRVALAWVHLDAGQTLEPHVHPVDSVILVCKGAVRALGDCEAELGEGDALLVPHGSLHGFTGSGQHGFWGISMQFDSRGLYEDLRDPWATFVDEAPAAPAPAPGAAPVSVAEALAQANERHLTHFAKHRLFSMARGGCLDEAEPRRRFLDCFQIWSNHFQRMLQVRAALADQREAAAVAQEHLADELGHNMLLEKSHGQRRGIWDPVLDATCSWFPWKVTTTGDLERTVLVHLVVEASASVFYREMSTVMADPDAIDHLRVHAHATDERHFKMGLALLEGASPDALPRLRVIQRQGWDMLESVFGRMAELVLIES